MHIFHHDFMRKHYYFIHMKIQIKCNFFINQNLFGINVSLQKSLFSKFTYSLTLRVVPNSAKVKS